MTEKEQLEKENEQFSSSVLYAATAIYVAVCAMVLGGLAARQPTFGDAFLKFFMDYGAIIAGLPVLIAVLVAKQQLEANRKQHVATVKRSLKSEFDLIKNLQAISAICSDKDIVWLKRISYVRNKHSARFDEREVKWQKRAEGIIPTTLIDKADSIRRKLRVFNQPLKGRLPTETELVVRRNVLISEAEALKIATQDYLDELSQYWS